MSTLYLVRVLAQHLFQRARLHQVCAQFFQWPPEKTGDFLVYTRERHFLHQTCLLHLHAHIRELQEYYESLSFGL